jgi:hemerythrin-like metal-binding protein
MSLTEWDNRYELGIQEIDKHHQKLVELLNNTYNLILYSANKDEIQTILTELIKYTHYHFDTEKQMMKASRYAGLKTHVSKHNMFKEQLAVMMQNYLLGTPHVDTDIVMFLWDWLQKHILKYDKKLAAYLSQNVHDSMPEL